MRISAFCLLSYGTAGFLFYKPLSLALLTGS